MEVEKINITIKRRQDVEFLTKIQMQEELKDRKELRRYNGKVSGSRDFLIDALWTCVKDEIKEEKEEREFLKNQMDLNLKETDEYKEFEKQRKLLKKQKEQLEKQKEQQLQRHEHGGQGGQYSSSSSSSSSDSTSSTSSHLTKPIVLENLPSMTKGKNHFLLYQYFICFSCLKNRTFLTQLFQFIFWLF